MNRRGFLSRLSALPIAVALALKTPLLAKPSEAPVVFPADLSFDELMQERYIRPAMARLVDDMDKGFSISYIRQFDLEAGAPIRFDVLYGVPALSPQFAVRVAS